ncbi:MAG: hypothetical protein H6729_02260 [Deltaproteobacteria bacterium]|nr:hypothetical protein [Deltaproteobacteria bacterium]
MRTSNIAAKTRLAFLASGAFLVNSVALSTARAELWNPLDAIPKPNAIVGLDSSVTMGITPGCDDCHAPGSPGTKLELVKTSINATLPLFQDHFVFGGFEYSGCGSAKIDARAVPPDPTDPDGSFAALQTMIGAAQHCTTRERYLPGMNSPASTGYATIDGPAGDVAVFEALFKDGALANDGFDPGAAWRTKQCGSASVGNPCGWWPPKPPDVDPPDPPPAYCPCSDDSCHIRTNPGNVWVMAGGCAGDGEDMYDGGRYMGTCDSADGCCIWVPCVNGMCYAYLSENTWKNRLCDRQPPPNPPYDPYPCWGVEGTPVGWPDINPGPPPGCILQNPDYPYYINAPICVDDPQDANNWCVSKYILCASGQTMDTESKLLEALEGFQFPRWYGRLVTAEMVEEDLCTPLRDAVRAVRGEMMACNGGPLVEYPDPDAPGFCDANLLKDAICTKAPFAGTCVCDDSDPRCSDLQPASSACGTPLDFKARQQVAVCETYHPDYLRHYYLNQPDNRVAGGCRENMSMFFTDGYAGQSAGVAAEAAKARPYYETEDAESNMFVFRVSDVFSAEADALSQTLGQGAAAFDATDLPNIQASMARVLNRAYRGVYSGSSPASGTFSANVAIHSFTVPGGGSMPPGDTYLGFPSRVSLYRVDHYGALVDPPLFETDWASSVSASAACGPTNIGGTDVAMLGPDGSFRNGVSRAVSIPANSVDRDGDGQPDAHPPLTWGKSFSIGSTQPVVVEGPRDALTAPYQDYAAVEGRPRMVYVMSNGYLLGYYAGTRNNIVSLYGDQKVSYSYSIDASAGAEILRYRPSSWLQDPRVDYQYDLNDLIQQPIITGELMAQEMVFDEGTPSAAAHTVLVGMQGKTGPGVFSLDITDPCSPSLLAEWTLPGSSDHASADPVLGTVLDGAQRKPALVTTGGLGGSASIYAFDVRTGAEISSLGLPAGSYPSAPACVDVTGEGRMTHCYVLSEAGRILRVELGNSGFTSAVDITPAGIAGPRFSTSPVAFFGVSGEVNLVFGSGNFEDFDKPDAQNFLFKVVDRGSTQKTMPSSPADISSACKGSGSGKIALAPGERIISKPLVADELVAWTAFMPTTTDCLSGRTSLYAMDFETCDNLLVPANGTPPAPRDVGEGFATTPILHTVSQSLIVAPSAAPTAGQVDSVGARLPNGGPLAKKVFYRPWTDTR